MIDSWLNVLQCNVPLGGVEIPRVNVNELPCCQCRPTSEDPCGPDSDCINRHMLYECHPSVCPNGDRCLNQRFQRRQYPAAKSFRTDKRGWGLIACVDIHKVVCLITCIDNHQVVCLFSCLYWWAVCVCSYVRTVVLISILWVIMWLERIIKYWCWIFMLWFFFIEELTEMIPKETLVVNYSLVLKLNWLMMSNVYKYICRGSLWASMLVTLLMRLNASADLKQLVQRTCPISTCWHSIKTGGVIIWIS